MHDDIREFLDSLPNEFGIMEEGIDLETQKEYLEYSDNIGRGELSEGEIAHLGSIIFDAKTEVGARKKALILLAHVGSIAAFRQIEKYDQYPGNEIKQWTALALQECKMFLESMLTDRSTGFILSGLGGHGDKLRYFYLVLPLPNKTFTSTQKNIIKKEFDLAARDLNCVVESVDPAETFVGLTVLVPMDVAIGTLVDTGIEKCNELGDFVLEHYYVTNQDIPTESEIPDIIKKVRE